MCDVYLIRIIVHLKIVEVFHYVININDEYIIFHLISFFSKLFVYTIGTNG